MTKEEIYITFEKVLEEYGDGRELKDAELTAEKKDELMNILLEAMKN